MTNLDSILKSRDIILPTKVRLVKAMVSPVVMYGCESWTVNKAEHQRIDVFELWCWRKLLRVPWTARVSNQSILKEISPGISLEGMMLKLKLQYFGHLMQSWLIGKASDAGRDWGQEEKGTTEDEMGSKTLESPVDCKEIKSVHPKGNQSWIFIGRTDAEAEAPVLWSPDTNNWLTEKDRDFLKDWRQEEKGTTEDEMVAWHHQLDGSEFEQTPGVGDGQVSLTCCSPWSSKESTELSWLSPGWATELNETERWPITKDSRRLWACYQKSCCQDKINKIARIYFKCLFTSRQNNHYAISFVNSLHTKCASVRYDKSNISVS